MMSLHSKAEAAFIGEDVIYRKADECWAWGRFRDGLKGLKL